jgi:hypothetical protein
VQAVPLIELRRDDAGRLQQREFLGHADVHPAQAPPAAAEREQLGVRERDVVLDRGDAAPGADRRKVVGGGWPGG